MTNANRVPDKNNNKSLYPTKNYLLIASLCDSYNNENVKISLHPLFFKKKTQFQHPEVTFKKLFTPSILLHWAHLNIGIRVKSPGGHQRRGTIASFLEVTLSWCNMKSKK